MAKATPMPVSGRLSRRIRESAFFVLLPVALYVLLALLSHHPDDSWSQTGGAGGVRNVGGELGAWLADTGFLAFGYLAFLFPVMLAYAGWVVLRGARSEPAGWPEWALRAGGFVLLVCAGSALAAMHFGNAVDALPQGAGGILGDTLQSVVRKPFGHLGSTLLLLAFVFAGITLFTGVSWVRLSDYVGSRTLQFWRWLGVRFDAFRDWSQGRKARQARSETRAADKAKSRTRSKPKIEPTLSAVEVSPRADRELQQIPLFETGGRDELPPLNLLDEPPPREEGYSPEALEALARQVEIKLADFRVEVEVVGIQPGPVITRFELQPAPGVKGSQVAGLAKDLARGLSVTSVRVVDVIPGKSVIGLEIPNALRETVYLREVLASRAYDKSPSPLTLALGKGISGKPVVADIAKMPHLLVAGTTGSGKSVALNAMILSILYKATPERVRLIMIDPKMLELSVYEGIPHLLAPVVTDMKEAANALRWCVAEMERRYRLMAHLGVRNLAGYNRKIRDAEKAKEPLLDPFHDPDNPAHGDEPEPLTELPLIVVLIDEFADMMMIVGKKVEELIARLAQKARASGIHLILATQRPSVDVITGLIKANVPTRIAFQVSSKVDSRTILDQMGAEQLLGHGDMLFLPPGTATSERVHGAFVQDHEVHSVVDALRAQGEPQYEDGVLMDTQVLADGQTVGETGLPEAPDAETDELYDQAVAFVLESRRASISSVQRKLKVGYNRAARMIEDMEAAGLVSAPQHNGTREVLVPAPQE